ncbi:MAG: KUP/HAK/KT family potassium transporter, partial [Rhodanobacteraceae bacterium]
MARTHPVRVVEAHNATDGPAAPSLRALAFGAVGVVFGDIGTSPLYTLQEIFSSQYGLEVVRTSVLGV